MSASNPQGKKDPTQSPASASRLGRGLSALIPPREPRGLATGSIAAPPAGDVVRQIAIAKIRPNPRQPRQHFEEAALDELSDSIRASGVLQPILVRRAGEHDFELIAGERRWRAAQKAGLSTIPAIIRDISDEKAVEIALIENLQREDLEPLERATAYEQYIKLFHVTPDELARRLSESRATVSNHLRLLKLAEPIQTMIRAGELGMSQARAIAGVADAQRQLALAKMAVRRNLSVRQVEQLATHEAEGQPAAKSSEKEVIRATQSRHADDLARQIGQSIGLPVRVRPGKRKNSGQITISYSNLDEFDRLAERLTGKSALA